MGRCGPAFEEGRYHQHVLDTPREVRRALEYIRWNTWKHAKETGRPLPRTFVDPYTIGFFGDETLLPDRCQGMVVEPRGWLLCHGWRLGATRGGVAAAIARETRRRKAMSPSPLPLFASMDAAGANSADFPIL
jgi:hypothetical protein